MNARKFFELCTICACLLFIMNGSTPLAAQQVAPDASSPGKQTPSQTVIKHLRYVQASTLREILSVLPVQWRIRENSVLVRGDKSAVETALKVIENLDVRPAPVPSIELRGYILAVTRDDDSVTGVPESLNGVIEELREIFGYRGFKVFDTVFLRTRNGSGGSVGGSVSVGSGHQVSYDLGFQHAYVPDFDRSREDRRKNTIRLIGLALRDSSKERPALETDVDVREGQTAVLGKAHLEGVSGDVILVVESHVLDGGDIDSGYEDPEP